MKGRILIVGNAAVFLGIASCLWTVMDIAMHVSLGESSELPSFPEMGKTLIRMAFFVLALALIQTAMLIAAVWRRNTETQ
jgi:hypothetical protein